MGREARRRALLVGRLIPCRGNGGSRFRIRYRSRYDLCVIDDATIIEAGRRLSEAAPGARIVLFGSHARGDAGPRSDLDFLVVEPEVENTAVESVRLRRALRGMRIMADVVVVRERDVEDWRDVRGSLVHAALADGRVLVA